MLCVWIAMDSQLPSPTLMLQLKNYPQHSGPLMPFSSPKPQEAPESQWWTDMEVERPTPLSQGGTAQKCFRSPHGSCHILAQELPLTSLASLIPLLLGILLPWTACIWIHGSGSASRKARARLQIGIWERSILVMESNCGRSNLKC